MRGRYPESSGVVERDGVRIAYESFGSGDSAVLLTPPWTIVTQRDWRGVVPYLARYAQVVTYDPRGNGGSDRPADVAAYAEREYARDGLAIMDTLGIERFGVVGWSSSAITALLLAAEQADRVNAVAVIAPSVGLVESQEHSLDFDAVHTDPRGWELFTRNAWRERYPEFVEWFCGECYSEPFTSRALEVGVAMCLGTSGEVLARAVDAAAVGGEAVRSLAARVRCPVLVVHGDADRVCPVGDGEELARICAGRLIRLGGADHCLSHEAVQLNLSLREHLLPAPRRWSRTRPGSRPRRALFLSSPFGLGHARRDLAIAVELRRIVPDLEIDWLAQHPVTEILQPRGERIHPASAELASESAHAASLADGHSLNVFQAGRTMDEIALANFMVFHDVTRDEQYDLWIADEALEVDYFLHENPELKTAPYAWLTDWIGCWPTASSTAEERSLIVESNLEMLEQVRRLPQLRDAAIFIGDRADIPPGRFGPSLPSVRRWAAAHYSFSGYVCTLDGYAEDRAVGTRQAPSAPLRCIVAVGGSGIGRALLERALAALPALRDRVPGFDMLAITGPRIDPSTIPAQPGLEVAGFVDDLPQRLAECDVAVIQGGLTTSMELITAGTPFVYVPLDDHFEQEVLVQHRLMRHGAGPGLAFADTTPTRLAGAVLAAAGAAPRYRDVPRDGARRVAQQLADLLEASSRNPGARRPQRTHRTAGLIQ